MVVGAQNEANFCQITQWVAKLQLAKKKQLADDQSRGPEQLDSAQFQGVNSVTKESGLADAYWTRTRNGQP
jgi:hypothetical protein